MLIIPAIDLLGGKVVRLEKGDYAKVKVYSDNPLEAAFDLKSKGASYIHVVDLDGARAGELVNIEIVREIVKRTGLAVELGGGIRTIDTINFVLDSGVEKVVLGTAVFKDVRLREESVRLFGDKVVFGIDARRDTIAVNGWTEDADMTVSQAVRHFQEIGVKRIIYTDIAKDGMMQGPNIPGLKKILDMTSMEVIASGGVSCVKDVSALKELKKVNLKGVIIGKALYEGELSLREAIDAG